MGVVTVTSKATWPRFFTIFKRPLNVLRAFFSCIKVAQCWVYVVTMFLTAEMIFLRVLSSIRSLSFALFFSLGGIFQRFSVAKGGVWLYYLGWPWIIDSNGRQCYQRGETEVRPRRTRVLTYRRRPPTWKSRDATSSTVSLLLLPILLNRKKSYTVPDTSGCCQWTTDTNICNLRRR